MLSFFILLSHSPVINFFLDVGIGFVLGFGYAVYRRYKKNKAGK